MYKQLFRCAVVVHSAKKIEGKIMIAPKFMMADVLIGLLLAKGIRRIMQENLVLYIFYQDWSGLVLMAENSSIYHWMHVRVDCRGSYNINSTRGDLLTMDSIPPLHRQVLVVISQVDAKLQYEFKHRTTHTQSDTPYILNSKCKHFPPIIDGSEGLHNPRRLD